MPDVGRTKRRYIRTIVRDPVLGFRDGLGLVQEIFKGDQYERFSSNHGSSHASDG